MGARIRRSGILAGPAIVMPADFLYLWGLTKILTMTIERTADAIILKLPPNINIEEIQLFLNYLRFKEIVAKSKATQEDVDQLAREVNKSWWEKNKQRFLPEE
jgi:hypothetical protein